jgi:hypothetical protein
MAVIAGNTFPVKDQLRALGGRWVASSKSWFVPDAVAEQARLLVQNAGPGRAASPKRGPRVCKDCGCKINYGVYCGKCEYR